MHLGYFKPLRRKIGVMTLVVACVLMAASICLRTAGLLETVVHAASDQEYHLLLSDQVIVASRHDITQINNTTRRVEIVPVMSLSYAQAVVPLTLLSAWLLLSKSRAKADSVPQIADTPINNE